MPYTRFVIAIVLCCLIVVLTMPLAGRTKAQTCPPGPKGEECRSKQSGTQSPTPTPRPSVRRSTPAVTPVQKAVPKSFTVTQTAEGYSVNLGAGVRLLELVSLKGDEFTMGSNKGRADEKSPHPVRVSAFSIGKYEVRQSQWKAVMDGKNPSRFTGDDLPVENVSWNDAVEFCNRLSTATGQTFRLPTEAEWEYAARAGTQTEYSFGDDEKLLGQYAWYDDNSKSTTHPVGSLKANQFGLFDMHGNIWEWCEDWYDGNYYGQFGKGVVTDPLGPSTGIERVIRGGGWHSDAVYCRSADRNYRSPGIRNGALGFRLVRNGR